MFQIKYKRKQIKGEKKIQKLHQEVLQVYEYYQELDLGIKIVISSIGNVETDLRSEFTAQGINQTLHRIYLNLECEVTILTPYDSINEKIDNQVLIAESVIIGNIPASYYNIEMNKK